MFNVIVLLTCYNRCDYTKRAISKLVSGNSNCNFKFIAVDDGSKDGTIDMLNDLSAEVDISIINGGGNLFYSGGMRESMMRVLEIEPSLYDYVLLINDDVIFFDKCIERMIDQNVEQKGAVIVGVCASDDGDLSYGGVKYDRGINYHFLGINDWTQKADTFNANCVLIPRDIFLKVPIMDAYYKHSLGDFDYGLSMSSLGFAIYPTKEYVGICNDNPIEGTWRDTRLPRIKRIRLKEMPKGSPRKQWFYFLKKNFNLRIAVIKSITPYVRIMMGK